MTNFEQASKLLFMNSNRTYTYEQVCRNNHQYLQQEDSNFGFKTHQ